MLEELIASTNNLTAADRARHATQQLLNAIGTLEISIAQQRHG